MFLPSPNNKFKKGDFRHKFVVHPTSKSSFYLKLYKFLGLMMGCSVRTGTQLTLDLPTMFWKQLVGQPIAISDLYEIDQPLCYLIKFMQNCSKEDFEKEYFVTWSTMLSDESVVELRPNGAEESVK